MLDYSWIFIGHILCIVAIVGGIIIIRDEYNNFGGPEKENVIVGCIFTGVGLLSLAMLLDSIL